MQSWLTTPNKTDFNELLTKPLDMLIASKNRRKQELTMREEYAERMLPTRPLEPVVMNDTNELARILISDLISELLN